MGRFNRQLISVLALGLPLAGSHIAQISITVTDTVMMGWYGIEELAALSLAGPFYFVLFLLGQGFALAVMPKVASALANEDHTQVRRDTRMGLWISFLVGLATMPIMWFSAPLLVAAGQEEELAQMVQTYLRIAGWSLPFFLMATTFKSFLAALEHSQAVLWLTLMGTGLNVVLNYAFIFGNLGAPELGLVGAAVASLGTHTLICLLLAWYSTRRTGLRRYAILTHIWRPDWEAFGQVFNLGLPISMTGFAESALFTASSFMMGWLGHEVLAAHGIALQIAGITFMLHVGLSSAATVKVGNAYGRRDPADVRIAALAALSLSMAVVAVTILAFLTIPELLVGLFLDPHDPQRDTVIALGKILLAMAALFQLVDALQVMSLGMLRGLHDTRKPMIIAVISYWIIGIPASYYLGFQMGWEGIGIWLGMAIGLAVAGISMMIRFRNWLARQEARRAA